MATDYFVRFAAQLRQHLKAFRKARNLTQAQLGDLIGVSQARIAEIEAHPGLVSFEQVVQLLAALDVTLSLSEDLSKWQPPEFTQSIKRVAGKTPIKAYQDQEEISGDAMDASDDTPPRYSVRQPLASWNATTSESSEPATDLQPDARRDYTARPKKGTW